MEKHTTGPWSAIRILSEWQIIKSGINLLDNADCAESDANALLAVAAPELLEACKDIAEVVCEYRNNTGNDPGNDYYGPKFSKAFDAVFAAIEKAEGKI